MPQLVAPTGLILDPLVREHHPGLGHPESPARFDAVHQGLLRSGLLDRCLKIAPRRAQDGDLLRCHTPAYLKQVHRDVTCGARELSTGDTGICRRSEEVARWAAGGLLAAADALIDGRVSNVFACVRPPGHHASPGRGMGFCIFNSIAVLARYLQAVHRLHRLLIVDWDVHHGNGTQAMFWRDPSVLFFSTHQMPLYPGSGHAHERGEGAGEGFTLNCPLRAGDGGREILAAFEQVLLPAADSFRPEAVLISAGFDGRAGDPLGGLLLEDEDFATLTSLLMDVAERHAGGRLIASLEGGYDLAGLASAVSAHVGALARG